MWGPPKCKMLRGKKYKGILEVRLTNNVQHRIFGCYGKGEKQIFVVLGMGVHKGQVYSPKSILDTVGKRKKEVENGKAEAPFCIRPQ